MGRHSSSSSSSSSSNDDSACCCWICLEGSGGGLERPCACPRASHPRCLARWQLQQAGRPEERACRFCGSDLPDWRGALGGGGGGGSCGPAGAARDAVVPRMEISAGGNARKLFAFPGPIGKALFRQQVRDLLGYAPDDEIGVVFDCRVPETGERLQLSGFGAYDAAVHCAAAAAASRHAGRTRREAYRRLAFVEHCACPGDAVDSLHCQIIPLWGRLPGPAADAWSLYECAAPAPPGAALARGAGESSGAARTPLEHSGSAAAAAAAAPHHDEGSSGPDDYIRSFDLWPHGSRRAATAAAATAAGADPVCWAPRRTRATGGEARRGGCGMAPLLLSTLRRALGAR